MNTKNGEPFIGKFKSWPNTVVAVWNEAEQQYVFAKLSLDLYKGTWQDSYFENVYVDESELLESKELVL
jgi:hypothetical protein